MGLPPSNRSPRNASNLGFLLIEGLVIFLVLGLLLFVVITLANRPAVSAESTPVPTVPQPGNTAATRVLPVQSPEPSATAQVITLAPTSVLPTLPAQMDSPAILGYAPFPLDVDPLTGLKVQDPSRLERRPVMVKVSNFPRTGRPHAGLSLADMVFEYYIGFGLNRFAAIYLGQDASQVGPIRSGRLVDAQLGEMYQSLLVYGDADPTIDDVLLAELGPRALAEKYLPSPPKHRLGAVDSVINLFTNTAEVTDYVNEQKMVSDGRRDLRGMLFSDHLEQNALPATEVGVQYGKITRGEWQYDAKQGKYVGYQEDPKPENPLFMIPWIDRLTKKQLAFSNIVLVFATYKEYAPTKHDVALYGNTNGKRAVLFRDGLMTDGHWKSLDNGRPLQFFNAFGVPYHLKPGNTWIVLAGDSSIFTEPKQGDWELNFDIP